MMDLPIQPPPYAPAPPPGPQARRSRTRMISLLVFGSICALLTSFLAYASFFSRKAPADHVEAISNAKGIHLALLNFDSDFGRFPDSTTISSVQKATGSKLSLGTSSSNDFFRQLLAADVVDTEKFFFAMSTVSPRKPNDVFGRDAITKGECAFAYVAGLSSSDDSSTPLAMAPVLPAKRCFERRKYYQNKAVILFLDGSVKSLPIDRNGKVQLNGMDLFDPRQPFWIGKTPDIKWPE